MEFKKQALRIPNGWYILYNQFYEIHLTTDWSEIEDYLDEDLFMAENKKSNFRIDLGWYPAADRNGTYRLRLVRPEKGIKEINCFPISDGSIFDWGNPILQFESRKINDVVEKIEEIMQRITDGDLTFDK